MHLGCYLTGPFGQSQKLYEVRNEEKRGRGSLEVLRQRVQQQILEDTQKIIQVQQEAGLDFIIDPLFGQYDIFQPLVEGIPGIAAGRQENWFNNNIFYQKLYSQQKIQGEELQLQGDTLQLVTGFSKKFLHSEFLPKDGKWMAILPSPYTLLELSEISGYQDKKSAIKDLAKLIKAEAMHLASLGAGRIQYDEPVLVVKQSLGSLEKEDLELLQTAMEVCGTIPDTSTILHTYFGDAAPLLSFLKNLSVDGIGIDGTETNLEPILQENFSEKELVLGLIDARSTDPEKSEELAAQLRTVAEQCQPKALWLTPTTGTEINGYTHALKKIEILTQTKRLFNDT